MATSHVVENFINGEFLPCSSHLDSIDPSTGEAFAKIPDSGENEVNLAVEAAKKAYETWSATTVEYRSSILMKISEVLNSRFEEFAQMESKDQGKPVSLARAVDIPRAVLNFKAFATSILHMVNSAADQPGPGAISYTMRLPVGVAGLISPWNLPIYLLTFKIAPAIAAGNTVVCKPSELTSVTAWMLCSVMKDAGVPPGVVNMVFGTGPKAGAAIVQHPDVPLISFTGSTPVGELITKLSAPFYKKLSLELGGKNAAVVFEDTDLEKCLPIIVRSGFANQGEICLCMSRVYVQRAIFDEFVEKYVEKTRQLKVGAPEDPSTNVGALNSLQHFKKVKSYVELATKEGGTILCGEGVDGELELPDKNKNGYFMRPTVVVGLADDTRCMQEEIFGPVVCISPFDTEEEAIKRANGVKYGLAACVYTTNAARLHRVAKKLEAGTVWCNCWLVRNLNMPFGGTKASGIGREGTFHSMEFYTEEKTICLTY